MTLTAFSLFEQVNCSYALTGVIACLVLYLAFFRRRSNLPPGPFNFPFVGCLPFLGTHPEIQFSEWSKKYGPVIYVKLGPHNTVVLNSYEAIEQAFVHQSTQFNGRPQTSFTRLIAQEGNGLILQNNQEIWKPQRRFGLKALSSANLHGKSLETRVLDEVELLCDFIKTKNEQPFVLETRLTEHIANVINLITMQRSCTEKGGEDLREYVAYVVQGFRKDGFLYILLTVAPWVCHFPPFSYALKHMREKMAWAEGMFNGFITENEKELDIDHPNNFLDRFLVERKKKTPSFEKKSQLSLYLRELLAAGTETSSGAIRWLLFYVIKNPEIQRKIHEEIDQVIGKTGKVRFDADLPYTKAVIQEIYRIETPIPISVPRSTTEDTRFMGYLIPKDTQIIPNLWGVHNDPQTWPNPRQFKPSRHLNKDGKFVKSEKIIPFSIGPRNCLGENLARMEVFLFVVGILQSFSVHPNPDEDSPKMKGAPGPIYSPHHYAMIMRER